MRQFKPGQLQTGSLYNISASYAITASHSLTNSPAFPFTGSARITGSLGVTGSISTTTRFLHSQSLDSNNRILYDAYGINSITWNSRLLANLNGISVLDWSDVSNRTGITTIPISEQLSQQRIDDQLASQKLIVDGKIVTDQTIHEDARIQGTIVYYNGDVAEWQRLRNSVIIESENPINNILGIVIKHESGSAGNILLQGNITFQTDTGTPSNGYPPVKGEFRDGDPLYLCPSEGGGVAFSAEMPDGAVRSMGHILQSVTNDNLINGIISFNPSNNYFRKISGISRIDQINGQGIYAQYAVTADQAISSSFATSASFASTASFVRNAVSASYAATSSYSTNLQISGSVNNVDYIDFNTGSATPAWKSGRVFWDNTDGALSVYNAEQDITLQVGQENWTRVSNRTGTTITNGTVVRLKGAHGDVPEVERAQSLMVSGSVNLLNQILGVATHDIEDNSKGYITTQGLVRGLNTNAFNDGDTLFVGTGSAGALQNVAPRAPFEIIPVGVCVKASPGGSGIIYVAVQEPIDFSDLSSALVQGTYNYGDLWTYVQSGSTGVWTHTNQLSGSYGITGSLAATSFTGSLFGTSSNATSALTASFIPSKTVFNQSVLGTGNIGFVTRSFTQGPTVTGTISEVQVFQLLIPSNTFRATDKLTFFAVFNRPTATGTVSLRAKMSTSSSMPSSNTSLIARLNPTANQLYAKMARDMIISDGNIKGFANNSTANNDVANSTAAMSSQSLDVTVDNYFYLSVQPATGSDEIRLEAVEIKNI